MHKSFERPYKEVKHNTKHRNVHFEHQSPADCLECTGIEPGQLQVGWVTLQNRKASLYIYMGQSIKRRSDSCIHGNWLLAKSPGISSSFSERHPYELCQLSFLLYLSFPFGLQQLRWALFLITARPHV